MEDLLLGAEEEHCAIDPADAIADANDEVDANGADVGRTDLLTVTTTAPKHCSNSSDKRANDNSSTLSPFTSSTRSPV
jgi:hypothetical protein